MGTPDDWQASSVQLAGIAKQVKQRGKFDAVLARCSPEVQAVMRDPHSQKWHGGSVLVGFSMALVEEVGLEVFRQMNHDMAAASFGPILGPMLQVALALTGRTPATLLARMPQAVQTALRNVEVTWRPIDPKRGVICFVYPSAIHQETLHAWKGALDFIGDLTGQALTYEREGVSHDTVELQVAWA